MHQKTDIFLGVVSLRLYAVDTVDRYRLNLLSFTGGSDANIHKGARGNIQVCDKGVPRKHTSFFH